MCSVDHELDRPSDLLFNRRKRVAPGCHWSNADGLAAAALRTRARMQAAAGWGAWSFCALSIVGHLEIFNSSSTPCAYAAAPCGGLADVHSSVGVWSFTMLLMAPGSGRGPYSTEPWSLAAADHSQASASSVCTLILVYLVVSQIWAENRVAMCQCDPVLSTKGLVVLQMMFVE